MTLKKICREAWVKVSSLKHENYMFYQTKSAKL